jgi:FkbM family methyltransferase
MKTFIKQCKWGNFLLLRGDMISQYTDIYGEWSELEVSLFKETLDINDNVIEIGANLGLHTIPLSRFVSQGKVICFEPQRIIYQILCANCAINNRINVYAYNLAVGDTPGQVEIPCTTYDKPWNYGSYSIKDGYSTEGVFGDEVWTEPVEVIKLDEHPDVASLKSLKLLKIDAEGMEIAVLGSAKETIAKFRPHIFVENNKPKTGDNLIMSLHSLDYDCYWFCSERATQQNYNKIRWKLPGADYNMICFPREKKIDSGLLVKVSAFADLKSGRVGWAQRTVYEPD